MSLVQGLVREFSPGEQDRLIALDATVFGGAATQMQTVSKKKWWWPFGG
jgi:hypothetical protein